MGSILWTNSTSIHDKKVVDQFFRQLEKDILYAQQYAMVHNEPVHIYWNRNDHYYEIERYAFKGELLKHPYDSSIDVHSMTMELPITFYPNGSIRKGGTIYIYYQDETYKIIFTIGKGRFRVEKL